jgi:tetratricopeptide (TPR) repeat protein
MRVVRLFILLLLAAVPAMLQAQIPTRRAPTASSSNNNPRLLVGNPHSFNAADSAPAVAAGEGLRTRIDKLSGGQFRVLTRQEMNDALKQFGYPADAILAPPTQKVLAQSLNSRIVVISTLSKDASGKYVVTSRLSGVNDDAGNVVSGTQAAGQQMADLGGKVAEGFAAAIKSWNDAKGCVEQTKTAPAKAAESAKKALATMPGNGLANYCMGSLALTRGNKADSAEAMKYFGEAVKGDPLSLAAWTQLAAGYEVAGDTAKTIDALQQMLRIAPTNAPLRDLVFKKLLAYGRPELAEGVADEGLKLDPSNVDLLDLLANARIFRENYNGALDALDQMVALDSMRADSTFYTKYLVTASAAEKPDAPRILKAASKALAKYPDNASLIKQAVGAYAQIGASDSLLPGLERLIKVDSAAAVGFALIQADTLQKQNLMPQADPYIKFVQAHGDAQAKDGVAGLMFQRAAKLLQPPPQWIPAADSLREVRKMLSPTARLAPLVNYYSGLALVNVIVAKDQEATKTKSCDLAKQLEPLAAEADSALAAADAYVKSPNGAGQAKTYAQLQGYVTGLKPHVASMIKVYCK